MKRAVNIRLEENVIYMLNQLATDLRSSKTEIIENAIKLFSKQNELHQHGLLEFAGKLTNGDADNMLESIKLAKTSKEFVLEL